MLLNKEIESKEKIKHIVVHCVLVYRHVARTKPMSGLNPIQDVENTIFLKGNFTMLLYIHITILEPQQPFMCTQPTLCSVSIKRNVLYEGFHGTYIKKVTINIYKLK